MESACQSKNPGGVWGAAGAVGEGGEGLGPAGRGSTRRPAGPAEGSLVQGRAGAADTGDEGLSGTVGLLVMERVFVWHMCQWEGCPLGLPQGHARMMAHGAKDIMTLWSVGTVLSHLFTVVFRVNCPPGADFMSDLQDWAGPVRQDSQPNK